MSGAAYLRAIGKGIAVPVVAVLGIGFAVILSAAVCGLCSMAVFFVGMLAVRHIAMIVMLLWLARPSMARATELALPAVFGLTVPLVFAADWQWFTSFGMPGTVGLSTDIVRVQLPVFSILGLCVAAWMAAAHPVESDARAIRQRYAIVWRIGLVCLTGAIVLGISALLVYALRHQMAFSRQVSPSGIWLLRVANSVRQIGVAMAAAASAVFVFMIFRERGAGGGPAAASQVISRPPSPLRPPVGAVPGRKVFGKRGSV